ncbi:MAG: GNAT family N-acetyltransferase [Syntrophaceae bacterium]
MSTVNIRIVDINDIDSLYSIATECFPGNHYSRFFISQACEAFANTFLVAENVEIKSQEVEIRPGFTIKRFAGKENHIVGYLLAVPVERTNNTIRILSMAVIPSERKKGIGGELLAVLENHMRYNVIKTLLLSISNGDTSATTFFERLGFEKESREDAYHRDISNSILKKNYTYSDRVKNNAHVRKLIGHVNKLYAEDRLKILDAIVESGGSNKDFLRKAHDNVLKAYNMQVGGKKQVGVKIIENWMEKRIHNSSEPKKMTPVRLAYEYRNYYRWPEKMDPFFRTVARRVKNKLYKRAKRSGDIG